MIVHMVVEGPCVLLGVDVHRRVDNYPTLTLAEEETYGDRKMT